jgi:hypothetical protein
MARTETTYDVVCADCGEVEEIAIPMAELSNILPCACGGPRAVTFLKPTTFHMAEMTGPIWSEKQIESSHGVGWRETPGSRRGEGGCGAVQYFHPGSGGSWGGSSGKPRT